ncbi:MAG: diaminopimelate decarboxylase [Gammaproteobacteria bacterium]|nr:MAG: diaminopimelate decarboxylase [Gammaproteobacteria bacterium]
MDHFNLRDGQLYAEDVPLSQLANEVGTPCYVYSRATLERHWHAFDQALGDHPHLICYAVKASSNLGLLNLLARLGSGFDIVSAGELTRVIRAGGDPAKVVFSGVGKTRDEMSQAIEAGIMCFNVESAEELELLNQVAIDMDRQAPVSLRVNPDVDAGSHPYISTGLKENKFGIDIDDAMALYQRARELSNITVTGLDCHIGSQLTTLAPFQDALDRLLGLMTRLEDGGITLSHIDVGGGLGIHYQDESPPEPAEYAVAILQKLAHRQLTILMEPGRAISGNAGVLLTRVQYLKHTAHKNFAIVDVAMNDLLRPSLYGAWQDIVPVVENNTATAQTYDVVGPICESGDFVGKGRQLNIQAGDLLAIRSAGAYGFSMSSNYNSRPRAAEVMVDGSDYRVVRQRETMDDLLAGESLLSNL